ncbi:hypothetical protein AB0D83_33980 [Streptomyces decoyicus]
MRVRIRRYSGVPEAQELRERAARFATCLSPPGRPIYSAHDSSQIPPGE